MPDRLSPADDLLQPGGEVGPNEPAARWAWYRIGAFMAPAVNGPEHGPLPDVDPARCDPVLFDALMQRFPWAWPQFRDAATRCRICGAHHEDVPADLCPEAAAERDRLERVLDDLVTLAPLRENP